MSRPVRVFEWPEVAAALSEVYGYDILHIVPFTAIVDDGKGTIHIHSPGVKVVYEDPLSRDVERFLEKHEEKAVPDDTDSTDGGVAGQPSVSEEPEGAAGEVGGPAEDSP